MTDEVRGRVGSAISTTGWSRQWRAYPVAFALRTVILGLGCLFCKLLLPLRASSKENVVDKGILQKGQKHKDKAAHEVHVNGFDVGDFGQRLPKVRVDGRHGQDGRDPYKRNGRVRGGSVPFVAHFSLAFCIFSELELLRNNGLNIIGQSECHSTSSVRFGQQVTPQVRGTYPGGTLQPHVVLRVMGVGVLGCRAPEEKGHSGKLEEMEIGPEFSITHRMSG